MFQKPFSFKGRIGRTEYGISLVIWIIVVLIINYIGINTKTVSIIFIFHFPLLWFLLAQGVKRCHDSGSTGWFLIIPLYIFWLIFAESIKGNNEYGPYPQAINTSKQIVNKNPVNPLKKWVLISLSGLLGGVIILLIVKSIIYQSNCFERLAPNTSLCNCNFENRDLSNKDLHNTNFSRANFYKADLKNVNFENANLTDANLSESNLTDALLTDVILDGANLQNIVGLSDEILCKTLKVLPSELSAYLTSRKIHLEAEEVIWKNLISVCSDTGVREASLYKQDSTFHPVILFYVKDSSYIYSKRLPEKFLPMAYRFCQLVACIEENKVLFNTCHYTNSAEIKRFQYQTTVVLKTAQTCEIVDQKTFLGSEPGDCPVSISSGRISRTITGAHVNFDLICEWLKEYVNPPK